VNSAKFMKMVWLDLNHICKRYERNKKQKRKKEERRKKKKNEKAPRETIWPSSRSGPWPRKPFQTGTPISSLPH
jgi:hypothetical protein